MPLSIFIETHDLDIAAGAFAVKIINEAPGFGDELRGLFDTFNINGSWHVYFANYVDGKCAKAREADGDIELMKAFSYSGLDSLVGFCKR